jgi:hypothetical protein
MLEVVQKGLVKIAKKNETYQFFIKILNDDVKSGFRVIKITQRKTAVTKTN